MTGNILNISSRPVQLCRYISSPQTIFRLAKRPHMVPGAGRPTQAAIVPFWIANPPEKSAKVSTFRRSKLSSVWPSDVPGRDGGCRSWISGAPGFGSVLGSECSEPQTDLSVGRRQRQDDGFIVALRAWIKCRCIQCFSSGVYDSDSSAPVRVLFDR